MDCTITADTPSMLLALLAGCAASAIALLGLSLSLMTAYVRRGWWRHLWWTLAVPVAVCDCCIVVASSVWSAYGVLTDPAPCDVNGGACGLIVSCDAVGQVQPQSMLAFALTGAVLLIGLVILYALPERRERPHAAIWPYQYVRW